MILDEARDEKSRGLKVVRNKVRYSSSDFDEKHNKLWRFLQGKESQPDTYK